MIICCCVVWRGLCLFSAFSCIVNPFFISSFHQKRTLVLNKAPSPFSWDVFSHRLFHVQLTPRPEHLFLSTFSLSKCCSTQFLILASFWRYQLNVIVYLPSSLNRQHTVNFCKLDTFCMISKNCNALHCWTPEFGSFSFSSHKVQFTWLNWPVVQNQKSTPACTLEQHACLLNVPTRHSCKCCNVISRKVKRKYTAPTHNNLP